MWGFRAAIYTLGYRWALAAVRTGNEELARVQAAERQRQEIERRRQEHLKALGDDLLQMTGRWVYASNVRAFLDAYQERLDEGDVGAGVATWLSWRRNSRSG